MVLCSSTLTPMRARTSPRGWPATPSQRAGPGRGAGELRRAPAAADRGAGPRARSVGGAGCGRCSRRPPGRPRRSSPTRCCWRRTAGQTHQPRSGQPYHLHYVAAGAGLPARVRALTAAGLAHAIDDGAGHRLRVCGRRLRAAFVDTSRNGRRQFCSVRCANQVNVARHRLRHGRPQRGTSAGPDASPNQQTSPLVRLRETIPVRALVRSARRTRPARQPPRSPSHWITGSPGRSG